tara:strand:+ start:71 stop:448 length:378 start_codon:yes stop_codon:yes gene_type:complete
MALELHGTTGVSLVQDGVVATADLADSAVTTAKLAGDAVPIGAGQTWQNVTRTTGTTYYNTTGRTICFSVNFSGANTFNLSVSTAGHLFLQGSAGTYKNLSVLIPAGERYIPTYSFTLYNMLELR